MTDEDPLLARSMQMLRAALATKTALVKMLLGHRPVNGRVVDGGGETVVAGACLYERTGERAYQRGEDLAVYENRADCCEATQRGAEDRCE